VGVRWIGDDDVAIWEHGGVPIAVSVRFVELQIADKQRSVTRGALLGVAALTVTVCGVSRGNRLHFVMGMGRDRVVIPDFTRGTDTVVVGRGTRGWRQEMDRTLRQRLHQFLQLSPLSPPQHHGSQREHLLEMRMAVQELHDMEGLLRVVNRVGILFV